MTKNIILNIPEAAKEVRVQSLCASLTVAAGHVSKLEQHRVTTTVDMKARLVTLEAESPFLEEPIQEPDGDTLVIHVPPTEDAAPLLGMILSLSPAGGVLLGDSPEDGAEGLRGVLLGRVGGLFSSTGPAGNPRDPRFDDELQNEIRRRL